MEILPHTEESDSLVAALFCRTSIMPNVRPIGVTKKKRDGIQQWTRCFVQHNITHDALKELVTRGRA
jgi:hypothetical protein